MDWEYDVFDIEAGATLVRWRQVLAGCGAQGWNLFHVIALPAGAGWRLLCKRPASK